MPTVVNNVETLAYLVPILERGAEWFASVGTERSKGYKIVSVSGHVRNPGNYEIPLGTTVREIIELAGGLRPGRTFMAVQPGGGSSACIFEEHLDWPYDYESMAKAGSMLGSGAFVVFDDTTDFVQRGATTSCASSRTSRAGSARPAARAAAGWNAFSSGSCTIAAFPATTRCSLRVSRLDYRLEPVRARRLDRAVPQIGDAALSRRVHVAHRGESVTEIDATSRSTACR